MKKNKKDASLTAKQRKQQRLKGTESVTAVEVISDEEKAANIKKRNSLIIKITAISLACAVALGSIIFAIVMLVNRSDFDNDTTNPYAIVKLSNGEQIEFELLWKQNERYNRAIIANFIYLSEYNFFDNTMFSNTQNDFLLMSGFTAPTTFRGKDVNFLATLKGLGSTRHNDWGTTGYKLGYRFKTPGTTDIENRASYVAFLTSSSTTYRSSTSFLFVGSDSANLYANNEKLGQLTYFARMTADSLEVVRRICERQSTPNSFKGVDNWGHLSNWQNVMISDVVISGLNSKIKENILLNFEEYVYNDSSTMEGALKGGYSSWGSNAGTFINTALS